MILLSGAKKTPKFTLELKKTPVGGRRLGIKRK